MTFFCGQNYLNHLARRSPGFNIPLRNKGGRSEKEVWEGDDGIVTITP
jgi:hypothetical protein